MFLLILFRFFVALLFVMFASTKQTSAPLSCKGGSLYFNAHPSDSLLYQQPDLYHDIYVYKCLTSVVFSSGDRGIAGRFSRSLEKGLEAAYASMAGAPTNEAAWTEAIVQVNGYNLTMRFLKDAPQVSIIYLRLPDGAPDGQGYRTTHKQSLKKLYEKKIESITSIDGEWTYTLQSLMDLVTSVLKHTAPRDIRVLDFKCPVPEDGDFSSEHADHAISARLVVDVVKQEKIEGNLRGYAGSHMLKLGATLNENHPDFFIKSDAFFEYARHDKYICQTREECVSQAQRQSSVDISQDVKYVDSWLDREYYVS